MKIAIIGSRGINSLNLSEFIPENVTEIVSGGAKGVDTLAKHYALCHDIKLTEILPDYKKFGKSAPLKRNIVIADRADVVFAFWDGSSKGTLFVIDYCKKKNIKCVVTIIKEKNV